MNKEKEREREKKKEREREREGKGEEKLKGKQIPSGQHSGHRIRIECHFWHQTLQIYALNTHFFESSHNSIQMYVSIHQWQQHLNKEERRQLERSSKKEVSPSLFHLHSSVHYFFPSFFHPSLFSSFKV